MQLPEKALAETAESAPKRLWDRVISLTPVVMTVIATILAGLSSSEMSIAQYHRALAAQNQSKAGDQWSFYQAKKLRQATMDSSLDLLQGLGSSGVIGADGLGPDLARLVKDQAAAEENAGSPAGEPSPAAKLQSLLADPKKSNAIAMILAGKLPKIEDRTVNTPQIQAVLDAADQGQDELQSANLTRKVSSAMLAEAFKTAEANARDFDDVSTPITKAADQVSALLSAEAVAARVAQRAHRAPATSPSTTNTADNATDPGAAWRTDADQLNSDFTAAKLRWQSLRYAADARYNFASARLYEVQVRRSSTESERHRDRSKDFFYGMLAAQAAVTIATFSLAVKQRSLLWGLATLAGIAAIALGIYVYLFT